MLVPLQNDNVLDVLDGKAHEKELKLIHLGNDMPRSVDPFPLHLEVALTSPWTKRGLHPYHPCWWRAGIVAKAMALWRETYLAKCHNSLNC